MENKESVFSTGKEVDLMEMLDAREKRAYYQKNLLSKTIPEDNSSLLVMTMAIPGPIKTNEPLNQAFDEMVNHINDQMDSANIIETLKREENTGYEYYILSTLSPREMKEFAVGIEETHPLGRLFDIDVLKLNDEQLIEGTSRTQLGLPVRKCFICSRPAKDCGRSRRHTVEELQDAISQRITQYLN